MDVTVLTQEGHEQSEILKGFATTKQGFGMNGQTASTFLQVHSWEIYRQESTEYVKPSSSVVLNFEW